MKKTTQRTSNPYPNSDSNKRYFTYEYYLRRTYDVKCAKIPLDAGFSCPNIDAGGGCIYCSARGSGDGIPAGLTLRGQYDAGRLALSGKWDTGHTVAYLQAHTNTYAPVEVLRRVYSEVLTFPGVCGMNVATRADCLPDEVCALLAQVAQRTNLTVELGLQSSRDTTAAAIGRGHTYADFLDGAARLRAASDRIGIGIHIIFGLPGEDAETMLATVRDVARLRPEQVKIHLLCVLKNTPLERMWQNGEYTPLTQEEYVSLTARALTYLPPETVIARLTGDGMADELCAPDWSRRKIAVINGIDRALYASGDWQGKYFDPGAPGNAGK